MTMALSWRSLEIPFNSTFTHGSATRSRTQSVWVEARVGEHVGVGESCPREYVTGESLESCRTFFEVSREAVARMVSGASALRLWADEHAADIDRSPAGWCAIELACLELFARQRDVPVETVLGVPNLTGCFHYSAVIGDAGLEVFRATAQRYLRMGFDDFKVKLSGDLVRDREKIDTLRALAASGDGVPFRVRVDANNLWRDVSTALRHLTALDYSFAGIEEPLTVNDLDGMRHISRSLQVPVILDESCLRADHISAFAGDPEHWIVNVRVSKMGGLHRALTVIDVARAAGIPIVVGAQVGETSVLTRAGLIAARAAGDSLFAHEGAFGTHLLQRDVTDPPIMFAAKGVLDADAYSFGSAPGWGLRASRLQRGR